MHKMRRAAALIILLICATQLETPAHAALGGVAIALGIVAGASTSLGVYITANYDELVAEMHRRRAQAEIRTARERRRRTWRASLPDLARDLHSNDPTIRAQAFVFLDGSDSPLRIPGRRLDPGTERLMVDALRQEVFHPLNIDSSSGRLEAVEILFNVEALQGTGYALSALKEIEAAYPFGTPLGDAKLQRGFEFLNSARTAGHLPFR